MGDERQFLKELDKKLWTAADKLRSSEKFIDARASGYIVDPVLQAFTDEDTSRIVSTFHTWKRGRIVSGKALAAGSSAKEKVSDVSEEVGYRDTPGFYKSATMDEIAEPSYVLTSGRTACAEEVEDDGVPFAEKMAALTSELADQFAESTKLEKAIRKNMKAVEFELPVGGKK